MTRTDFLTAYPEFTTADATLIESVLSRADHRTSTSYPADVREDRVALLAAQILALTPSGRDMRLVNDDGSTVYDGALLAMDRAATCGVGRVC